MNCGLFARVGTRGSQTTYLIDVVEAAHADAEDDAEWLRGILQGAQPMVDHGLGCGGYLFDAQYSFPTWNVTVRSSR